MKLIRDVPMVAPPFQHKRIALARGGFVRLYITDGELSDPVLLAPPIGMTVQIFRELIQVLRGFGHAIISWELGDVGGGGSSFFEYISTYQDICDAIATALNAVGLDRCVAVSLCNGASLLANLKIRSHLEITRVALVSPYFHLPCEKHSSTYERTLMPLLSKAGRGDESAARAIHMLLSQARVTPEPEKAATIKRHLGSVEAIMYYARALSLYRETDEGGLLGQMTGDIALLYCMDDEAVSFDYFESIAKSIMTARKALYACGGHYSLYNNRTMSEDIAIFLRDGVIQHA